MNPMTNVKNVLKLSERELSGKNKTSWHEQYKDSAWIFIGGLPYDLTEGDVLCMFSQYGEPVNINLVRDKDTGKSKGFCFLCYEDQRSTVLAVDNLNSIKVLGRTIRVDHVENYKPPKGNKDELIQKAMAPKNPEPVEKSKQNDKINTEPFVQVSVKVECEEKEQNTKRKREDPIESKEEHGKKDKKKKTKKHVEVLKSEKEKGDKNYKTGRQKKRKKRKSSSSSSSVISRSSSSSSVSSATSSRSSTSSSLSSSSSSSSSSSEYSSENVREKGKKGRKSELKRSRTIDELKREARLIQNELRRRHRAEEKSGETGKKKQVESTDGHKHKNDTDRHTSKSRHLKANKKRPESVDHCRGRTRDSSREKRDKIKSSPSLPRREGKGRSRSTSNDCFTHNGHKKQHQSRHRHDKDRNNRRH